MTSIFEASERYQANGVPLVILAGKEYGSGSSRDWAAKGPKLLGVQVVIAEELMSGSIARTWSAWAFSPPVWCGGQCRRVSA